jgi:hypothetical protein
VSNLAHGLGENRCRWPGGCRNFEVDGLEYCVLHVPDELLDEAEDITGVRRCRNNFGTPDACRSYAAEGTVPPQCSEHGANPGSVRRAIGTRRVVEGQMAERLAMIMGDEGERLLHPDPIGDPLTELLALAAEIRAVKEVLRMIAARLFSQDRIRYAHSKVGEQLRIEILLYERAVERYAKILIDISKLKIEDRLAGVQEETARMLETALDAALEESGIGIDGITGARKAFRRHLKVVQGELA